MKRVHPFVLLVLAHAAALAQPTIDRLGLDQYASVYGYHDVPFMPVGKGGVGVKWDYSGLPKGAIVPYRWTTTDIAPGAGAFPTDAMVLQVPGEPTAYYQLGDTALYWLGTYTDTALVRFDPPLAMLDLPCSYSTTWQDTGVAAITGAGRLHLRITSLTAEADGWGTLVMPYGTVPNTLRVRYRLVAADRSDPSRVVLSETRYAWYCERTPMPLLVISEKTGWPPPERTLRWLDGTWQTKPESLFQPVALFAFPDPCDDVAYVDLPAVQADRTVLQLIDATGQIRKQWSAEFNSPQTRRLTLEMNDVSAGQYTLTWIGTNGTLGNARLQKR